MEDGWPPQKWKNKALIRKDHEKIFCVMEITDSFVT